MNKIRKQFKVEYAHSLTGSYSKSCQTIHGHSALIEVFLESRELLQTEMIIDFGELKLYINDIIQTFDHTLILSDEMDEDYIAMIKKYNKDVMIVNYNPTAECMSRDICEQIRSKLNDCWEFSNQIKLTVRFHETATGWAEWSEDLK